MPVSESPVVERIARVLAGRQLSGNALGLEAHASTSVDLEWKDRVPDAIAILRTLREPDMHMAEVGDVDVWRAMVTAAIDGYADAQGSNPLSSAINIKANS